MLYIFYTYSIFTCRILLSEPQKISWRSCEKVVVLREVIKAFPSSFLLSLCSVPTDGRNIYTAIPNIDSTRNCTSLMTIRRKDLPYIHSRNFIAPRWPWKPCRNHTWQTKKAKVSIYLTHQNSVDP